MNLLKRIKYIFANYLNKVKYLGLMDIGHSFFCGKSSDPLPKRTQGTATNPRLIQVWSGSGQTLGQRSAYDAVKLEQHGATLHYPFSWDEVDGTGEPAWSKTIKALLERL